MIELEFNQKGTYTGVNYSNTKEPILVGEYVEFKFNEHFGKAKGIICFKNGSYGALIENPSNLKGHFILISSSWTKL